MEFSLDNGGGPHLNDTHVLQHMPSPFSFLVWPEALLDPNASFGKRSLFPYPDLDLFAVLEIEWSSSKSQV